MDFRAPIRSSLFTARLWMQACTICCRWAFRKSWKFVTTRLQARPQTIGRLLLLRCGGLRVVLRKLTQRVLHYGNLPFTIESTLRELYAREDHSPALFSCAAA